MPLRRPYLVSHRSPRLRAWRLLGVVLMLTHSRRTVVDFLAKRRVEQAIATCLATPRATDFEGVPCAIAAPRRGLFRRRVGARPEDVGARPRNVYGDAVWWFLFADIFVHLVTGRRRRDGSLEPLNHDYAWLSRRRSTSLCWPVAMRKLSGRLSRTCSTDVSCSR